MNVAMSGKPVRVVMIDVDGVLADFAYGFTSLATRLGWEGEPIHDYERKQWSLTDVMSRSLVDKTWDEIKKSDYFWRNLPALATRDEFSLIQSLGCRHDVYFVTSRIGIAPKLQTELWLRNRGIVDPTVIISQNKGPIAIGLDADCAIDDKLDNVDAITAYSPRTNTYLLNHPYNQYPENKSDNLPLVKRVKTLQEFLEDIK